jgi:hypothetical protein
MLGDGVERLQPSTMLLWTNDPLMRDPEGLSPTTLLRITSDAQSTWTGGRRDAIQTADGSGILADGWALGLLSRWTDPGGCGDGVLDAGAGVGGGGASG